MDKLVFDLGRLPIFYFSMVCWQRWKATALTLIAVLLLSACGGGSGGKNNSSASAIAISQNSAEPVSSRSKSSTSDSSFSQASNESQASSESLASSSTSMFSSVSTSSISTFSNFSRISSGSSVSSRSSISSRSSAFSISSHSSSSLAAAIAGVEIAPGKVVLAVGASQQLVAVGRRSDNSLANLFGQVTWRMASGGAVASVDSNGLLKRLTAGTAEIEAKAQGKTAILKITSDVQNLSLGYDNTQKKWPKVNIYLWTGEGSGKLEPAGKWPGTAMSAGANNVWSHMVDASALKNGAINVIFNNGAGGAEHQTGDLVAKESAVYSGVWMPTHFGSSAQVAVIEGKIENPGNTFAAGTVISIAADSPADGASFIDWTGASAAYIFTDPANAKAQVVVPDGVASLFFQAHFLTVSDPFSAARNLYAAQCAGCHGVNGVGGTDAPLIGLPDTGRYTLQTLATKIRTTMPRGAVGQCIGDAPGTCAYDIANLIMSQKFPGADSCSEGSCALDSRNLRLLTTEEYLNSVRDIFAIDFDATIMSPAVGDAANRNFNTDSSIALNYSRTLGYQMAAEAIAKKVIETKTFFSLSSSCGTDAKCVVTNLGRKIFRRKLSNEEVTRYADLYTSVNGGKAVIQGLLISPSFMYRSEKGKLESSGLYRLTPYEIATLLSYSFWASTPDEALLNAAESGNLDIRAQVTRLLNDKERAGRGLRRFASGWLIDGKYGFSGMPASLTDAFQEETIRFTTETISADKPYKTLLSANYTYANAELAKYYGSAPVVSGWGPSIFPDGDPRRGSGILGHGSFLASRISNSENPSPIKRGLFVRGVLMCQELPPPQKAGVSIERKPTDSNRQANFNHTNDEACFGCHQYIDGIGFGFENFGSNGLFRTEETLGNGVRQAIDARGSIKSLNSSDRRLDPDSPEEVYNTLPELANLIAGSGQGSACYSRQFYRYIVGRDEIPADEKIIPSYSANLRAGGGMREMLIDLALNPSFVLRRK